MKLSEFQRAVSDEFGAGYGQALMTDLVLADLGNRTPKEAIAAGRLDRPVQGDRRAAVALVRRGEAGPQALTPGATRRFHVLEDMFGTG